MAIDNVKWVQEHAKMLDKDNVQATFQYIVQHHPYMGCAMQPNTANSPNLKTVAHMSLEEASRLADAVTIACCEHVGKSHIEEFDPSKMMHLINWTSLANTAYIVLHHSDPMIKTRASVILGQCQRFVLGAKTWCLKLNDPWFDHVLFGRKRFEGRRFAHQVKEFYAGDLLRFSHATDPKQPVFYKKIVEIHRFPAFEVGLKYFEARDELQQVLPGIASVAEGVNVYLQFVSLPTQLQDSVCFIELTNV